MQQGEAKQIDLVAYQQLEEAQSQNHNEIQNKAQIPKSEAGGSFVFQLDSPKQKTLQLKTAQNRHKIDNSAQNEEKEANIKTQLSPFSYQLELASQQSQPQRQKNEKSKEDKKQFQGTKQKIFHQNIKIQPKKDRNIDSIVQDQRGDRMNRRKKRSTFKDILNGSETNQQKNRTVESSLSKNQLKNIEYAKTQEHNQVPQIDNQRTDIPLKQDPLTVGEILQGLRQQKEQKHKQIRQSRQLPPLKRQRIKQQQQQPSFQNDSSIVALDKLMQSKSKSQGVVARSYQQAVFKQFAFKPILLGPHVKFVFKRQKNCMENYYHPQYSLFINQNKHIFSARKEWGHINSHYNISCEEKHYSKTGNYYAGYLKGNFTGTCFNLFAFNDLALQLVATIIYKAELNCIQQSYRQFQVYIKNQEYAYSQLSGYRQGELIDLSQIYEIGDNLRAKKIIKLVNKKAEWCQNLNAFVMNFKGKLKMPSVKNMIMVEQGRQHQNVLMLCKQQKNQFYLEIAHPLDPFLAMGIVLTSFDFKLFCQ